MLSRVLGWSERNGGNAQVFSGRLPLNAMVIHNEVVELAMTRM